MLIFERDAENATFHNGFLHFREMKVVGHAKSTPTVNPKS